jgi:hypothetical protein
MANNFDPYFRTVDDSGKEAIIGVENEGDAGGGVHVVRNVGAGAYADVARDEIDAGIFGGRICRCRPALGLRAGTALRPAAFDITWGAVLPMDRQCSTWCGRTSV